MRINWLLIGGLIAVWDGTGAMAADTRPRDSYGWVECSTNFVPLSDAEAAALVVSMTENRTSTNANPNSTVGDSNHYMPSATELDAFRNNERSVIGELPVERNAYNAYVTGGFTGTTDEIIQWAAIKWGIPPDWFRAQAIQESQWNQTQRGDLTTVADANQYPEYSRVTATSVYQSLGILQVRWNHPDANNASGLGAEPLRWKSTAFNMDHSAAGIRFYFDDPLGKRTSWGDASYQRCQNWLSIGGHFNPYPWDNAGQQNYVSLVQGHLANQPWLQASFPPAVPDGGEPPPPPPPPSGLVARWTMDTADVLLNQSTAEIRDTVGTSHGDLQNYTGNPVVAGKIGQALKLDGTNDLVVVPDQNAFSPSAGDLTVSLWVRVPAGTSTIGTGCGASGRYIITKTNSGNWEWGLENDRNITLCANSWQLNGSDHGSTSAAATIADGAWHHYAIAYDYLANITLYRDGVAISSRSSFIGTMGNGNGPLRIGARSDGNYFSGEVDDVRVYNRALSASEVAAVAADTGEVPPDTTAPSVPAGLASGMSCQIPLSWTASTDDVGVTGYRLYRDNALRASPTGTSYVDTGSPGASYSYQVSAVDAAGNESALSAAIGLTIANPCM